MYMKKYIFLAASALTLASCSSDDFLGDTPGSTPTSANSAIKFDGNAGKISRTSNTGTQAEMLGNEFKIYGVKSGAETGSGYKPVFQNYLLWYDEGKNTTTNKSGWEYVGEKGEHGPNNVVKLTSPQYIKFWDYASADYRFVAGAPSSAFEFKAKTDENDKSIESATITGLGGHINANPTGTTTGTANTFAPIYVANPITVAKTKYQQPVEFEFVRQQSMVRVGIYETIPGYKITDIKFYKQGEDGTLQVTTDNNIILTATKDYFVGGSNVTGTITYDWTSSTTPSYKLTYTETENNLVKNQNWYGGALDGVKAKTSTHQKVAELYGTDLDMDTKTGYFTVMTNPSLTAATPILIKCDYILESEDNSGETIKVTGATAAIPAAYSKWETNTRYTYLFKISDKTNGYTGGTDNPAGLYPITFNAAVKESKQGTITTFTTPSITTKQDGSVDENSGIKYVVKKPITVKVTKSDEGSDLNITNTVNTDGYIVVYKFTDPITEAEAQVKGIETGDKVTDTTLDTDKKVFTFTPNTEGYYVIQYLTIEENSSKVYTYKVVHVVKAAATK